MKYIKLVRIAGEEFNGKPLYGVWNKKSNDEIAQLFWYAPWRQWCARFIQDSVWSQDCLEDVRTYLLALNGGKQPPA